jgi:ADP-ribose pyrophosphatase
MSDRDFTKLSGETRFEGKIITVETAQYRFASDGEEVTRDVVHHPGAVGIVPVDDEHVYLVRQPRQAVDDPDSLEIPAGLLDKEGEAPLDNGKRELGEEIGKAADDWEHLTTFHTSVGSMDEQVHLYLATGVRDAPDAAPADENERIEIVAWPLDRLDEAIAATTDSKTLIGLLLLERRRAASAPGA